MTVLSSEQYDQVFDDLAKKGFIETRRHPGSDRLDCRLTEAGFNAWQVMSSILEVCGTGETTH